MKKLLLLLTVFVLLSCNQDKEILIDKEGKQAILSEEDVSSAELRAAVGFMDPSNQIPLYEYVAYSGSQYADTYYTSTHRGYSFYDSRTGRTFQYVRKMGNICRNAYPYYGELYFSVGEIGMYYNHSTNAYEVNGCDVLNPDCGHRGYTRVEKLGYILNSIHDEDRALHQENGSWDHLAIFKNRAGVYRLEYTKNNDALRAQEWFWQNSLGWVVMWN